MIAIIGQADGVIADDDRCFWLTMPFNITGLPEPTLVIDFDGIPFLVTDRRTAFEVPSGDY